MPTLIADTPHLTVTASLAVETLREIGRPELAEQARTAWLANKQWVCPPKMPQIVVSKVKKANFIASLHRETERHAR